MKYKTLKALRDAYKTKRITGPLILDNDCSFVYEGEEKVFDGGGPEELLPEALDLLGIPNEGV